MLTERKRIAAQTIAKMKLADRDMALRRGFVTVNIAPDSASGVWTPVNLDPDVVSAALQFRTQLVQEEPVS